MLSSAHRVGGGDFMIIIELIVSIVAQVAGYYLCKLLDRKLNNSDDGSVNNFVYQPKS